MSFDRTLPELTGMVLWLIPSVPFTSLYRKEIERLSNRYKTTRFEPHLTLGRFTDEGDKEQTLNHLDSHLPAVNKNFSTAHDRLECRATPYQNLIHVMSPSHDLKQFRSHLGEIILGFEFNDDYHISLMYGEIPCRRLEGEIKGLSVKLPGKINFSKISAIKLNGQPDSWRTLWEIEI